jgi:bacteriorhodopsin
VAAFLKVKASFSFIPFKGINGYLTRQIAFKWGWYVLFAGAALSVLGVLSSKKRAYTEGR